MDHSDRQATKKTPKKKLASVSPSFKGKNQRISTGKQPKKNWRAFPPFRGFKIDHSDRQATRKTPQKKMSIVLPLLQGNKPAVF